MNEEYWTAQLKAIDDSRQARYREALREQLAKDYHEDKDWIERILNFLLVMAVSFVPLIVYWELIR